MCVNYIFIFSPAKIETTHSHSTLGVSAPHLYYACPEGATAKLVCAQKGTALSPNDFLKRSWFFTPHIDLHCQVGVGPRKMHHSTNSTLPAGLKIENTKENMWLILENVTHADQGRYCCVIADFHKDRNHPPVVQRSHSHLVLQVTPRTYIT